MEEKEIDETSNKIAEFDSEFADALVELQLEEFIIEANTEYGRPLLGDTVLGYVEIGCGLQEQQSDEETLFTIAHTVGQSWIVIREIPGMHQTILGQFENAYGASGAVRQHHPATDPKSGGTPTYPEWLIEEVNPELGTHLKDCGLIEYVVEVDVETKEVAFSSNNRRPKIHLRIDTNSEWKVCISHEYGFDALGTWESLNAAIGKVERKLQIGEKQ
ncbi:hypothetical protein [Natrinema sp. DC36]|uniref:hypothetical protein n=1 Tax=Natrinema sp. DC36 TaxID=2878680 RepID=UPI001CF024BB|nr:hypothetical protein [Natrinema sp. DC36]